MERLMPVIKEAVISGLIMQATHRKRRYDMAGLGLIVLAGFMVLLATVFGALAGYYWLELNYTQPTAFVLTGGALLLISASFLLIGIRVVNRNETQEAHQSREEVTRLVDIITDDLSEEIAEPVRDNPKTAMAAAVIAGFIAGDKLH